MIGRKYFFIGTIASILIAILTLASPAHARSPQQTQTPKEALILEIQERARLDVQLGKQMQSTTDLSILFGEKAGEVGMSMSEVVTIYEEAYVLAIPEEPWWAPLQPVLTWGGLAAILLLVFQNLLKDSLTKLFNIIKETIYNQLAGLKPFWWIALRRYRYSLVDSYSVLKVPFRPDRPLNMKDVYVPLKASGSSDMEQIDAYQSIFDNKWLMVVGAPGSGKSMLLKHITLTYAEGNTSQTTEQRIPILLELNRLNDSTDALRDCLVDVLKRNKFPKAENFLKVGLENGRLIILFDGLDEVNKENRNRVIQQIRDLLNEHSKCQTVITCRTAVYNDEFANWVNKTLEITDFSDQQMEQFLTSWEPGMPEGKSIGNLLRNLHERPRIMALARNPLLLTIIAYLYTDTPFVLPHSRTEFYNEAVTQLLKLWKNERNKYKLSHKKIVLQHLALYNQDRPVASQEDRRSIGITTVMEQVRQVLPSLTLGDADAQPLIDEIVERSGLLLAIDGGTKYQFSHLTLQEFFAALAIESGDNLFERFKNDTGAWREVVKLWCGLDRDSSELIRKVFDFDKITAFECLGDAQKVDPDISTQIIHSLKNELNGASDNILKAFAIAAVDPRPRGKQVFDFLAEVLSNQELSKEYRMSAANALAQTNVPKAAIELSKYIADQPEIRSLLIQMGNLSIEILDGFVRDSQTWALDSLMAIGTPRAAMSLVPYLWDQDDTLAQQAAWRLSEMIAKPNVVEVLNKYQLTYEQRSQEDFNWVWEPFDNNDTDPIRIITGRIAHFLDKQDNYPIFDNPVKVDYRLAVPLLVKNLGAITGILTKEEIANFWNDIYQQPTDSPFNTWWSPVERFRNLLAFYEEHKGEMSLSITDFMKSLSNSVLKKLEQIPNLKQLFDGLDPNMQFELLKRMVDPQQVPTEKDWRKIFTPLEYTFHKSWHAIGIKLIMLLFCLLTLWDATQKMVESPKIFSWNNSVFIFLFLVFVVLSLVIIWSPLSLSSEPSVYDGNLEYYVAFFVIFSIPLIIIYSTLYIHPAIVLGILGVLSLIILGENIIDLYNLLIVGLLVGLGFGYDFLHNLLLDQSFYQYLITTVGEPASKSTLLGTLIGVALVITLIFDTGIDVDDLLLYLVILLAAIIGSLAVGYSIYEISRQLYEFWSWLSVAGFWVLWILGIGALWFVGEIRQREANNPLFGLLESPITLQSKTHKKLFRIRRTIEPSI